MLRSRLTGELDAIIDAKIARAKKLDYQALMRQPVLTRCATPSSA